MAAPNALHIIEGGDHSLLVSKTELKAREIDQAQVDQARSNPSRPSFAANDGGPPCPGGVKSFSKNAFLPALL